MSDTALLQKEFNIRRSAIAYTMCTDEDIWEEIRKEEEIGKEIKRETKREVPVASDVPNSADHIVDCNVDPCLFSGWRMEEHRRGGMVKLERRGDDLYANGKKVELFLSEGQKNDRYIYGYLLYNELADKSVLNANILDYLLKTENQHLIPDSWKGNHVSFWGDVYSNSDSGLFVRYVYWDYNKWDCSRIWFNRVFYSHNPSAVFAS